MRSERKTLRPRPGARRSRARSGKEFLRLEDGQTQNGLYDITD